jgi:hypothetical protein
LTSENEENLNGDSKSVPSYIQDIKDSFVLDGEDDESVETAKTSKRRQTVSSTHNIPANVVRHRSEPTTSNNGYGRQLKQSEDLSSQQVLSTNREVPSKRIVFPNDRSDVDDRRYFGRDRKLKFQEFPSNDLNLFDGWIPLTGNFSQSLFF